MRGLVTSGVALLALSGLSAAPPAARRTSADAVFDCRRVSDPAARLACFDKSVAAMQDAVSAHDLVLVDKEAVHVARRSLFGFNVPSLRLFGESAGPRDHGPAVEEESQITATLASAQRDGEGNWLVTLDDGAVWHQTDGDIVRAPKPGETVTIRRAAFGSYFMKIGTRPGVRAERRR